MTGSNCVHRPSDDIDDVTLGSDSDYVTAEIQHGSVYTRSGVGSVRRCAEMPASIWRDCSAIMIIRPVSVSW